MECTQGTAHWCAAHAPECARAHQCHNTSTARNLTRAHCALRHTSAPVRPSPALPALETLRRATQTGCQFAQRASSHRLCLPTQVTMASEISCMGALFTILVLVVLCAFMLHVLAMVQKAPSVALLIALAVVVVGWSMQNKC